MLGKVLVLALRARGHEVFRLVRRAPQKPDEIEWDPALGKIALDPARHFDAFINLSGENVGAGRWTSDRKAAILHSRIHATRTMVAAILAQERAPEVLVSASAVGFYGDRGDEWLSEESHEGKGFLAEVCLGWEAEAHVAEQRGVRVVCLRTGMVLAPSSGALALMLPVFRLGLGGRLGTGRQWMSWITIDDVVEVVVRACLDRRLKGAVNAVAPEPVTNREFTKALGKVLRRPTILPVPRWVLRGMFGQMADEALLASERIKPTRLQGIDFQFRYPEIVMALRAMLKRRR